VAGLFGQHREAAHEGAADAEDMDVHDVPSKMSVDYEYAILPNPSFRAPYRPVRGFTATPVACPERRPGCLRAVVSGQLGKQGEEI
jgi:hypothetical protein